MRAPEFAAYIGPARLYPELWRLLLGVLLILFIYLGSFAMMVVAAFPVLGPIEYFGWLRGLSSPSTPGMMLFVLGSFAGMFLGVVIAAAALQSRGPGSLFGPLGETLRGFFLSVLVVIPVYAASLAVFWAMSPPEANLPLNTWLRYLPFVLPLILLQTTSEELLFRGYLQQQLAVRFVARWVWMGLPALLFTALHWTPEAGNTNWLILGAILAFALIAADLTERTGSLGAAMGLHFLNNASAMLIVSVKGTLTGLSLFVTPYGIGDAQSLSPGLLIDIVVMFVIWRLLRFVHSL